MCSLHSYCSNHNTTNKIDFLWSLQRRKHDKWVYKINYFDLINYQQRIKNALYATYAVEVMKIHVYIAYIYLSMFFFSQNIRAITAIYTLRVLKKNIHPKHISNSYIVRMSVCAVHLQNCKKVSNDQLSVWLDPNCIQTRHTRT